MPVTLQKGSLAYNCVYISKQYSRIFPVFKMTVFGSDFGGKSPDMHKQRIRIRIRASRTATKSFSLSTVDEKRKKKINIVDNDY